MRKSLILRRLRALLGQRQGSHNHLEPSPSTTIKLPEDVLLDIFDSYRQAFEQEPRYEWTWNGKNGWFKLAHVCRKWRCVVLSSSSRLHVRLLFTSFRPSGVVMLSYLPTLPIVINHSGNLIWTSEEQNCLTASLRYPDRVRRIVITGQDLVLNRVYRAMNRPFPTLESFVLLNTMFGPTFEVPTTIFKGSAPSLRRLHLQYVLFASVSQLLSSTTGLVELNLDTDTIVCLSPAASLLTHLQGMPCLRRFQLRIRNPPSPTTSIPVFPTRAADVVSLLRLTHFRFYGSPTCFELLAAGLAAPFLQDLEIELDGYSPTSPHLSRFIGDVEGLFSTVLVDIHKLAPLISVLTHPKSIDELPRRIVVKNETSWSVQTCTTLCARLATVEILVLRWHCVGNIEGRFCRDPSPWRRFFEKLHNVKILRVQRRLVPEVARFLLQNSGEPPLYLLPALEEIYLCWASPSPPPNSDIEHQEALSALGPFVAARQQAGRPVRISWNPDQELRFYW
ncbi:hypothetical protein BJV78DRAFT_136670 [Lactifluus subvellereus]|nr:hypothetical protein BJV78DRAFT_136670 [Lactifluus subvellereus]